MEMFSMVVLGWLNQFLGSEGCWLIALIGSTIEQAEIEQCKVSGHVCLSFFY